MRTRNLIYGMLLLSTGACQKAMTDKQAGALAGNKATANASAKLLSSSSALLYKISSITEVLDTTSATPYDALQVNYAYNADGSLKNISTYDTLRSGGVITSILPTTVDYTYSGDSVYVVRVSKNSSGQITATLRLSYITDSLGRLAFRNRQIVTASGVTTAVLTDKFFYDGNGQLVSDVYGSSSLGFATYTYAWLNGNLSSSVTNEIDQYTYDVSHVSQPADPALLQQQLTFGFAVPVSANLTMSDMRYSSANAFSGGSKYVYTFDSKGRVSKVMTLDVPYYAPQTTLFNNVRYVRYVNN